MRIRKAAASIAVGALAVAGVALASAPEASACPTLYWDINLGGRSFYTCGTNSLVPNGYNDAASSVRASDNTRLFEHTNGGGRMLSLTNGYWYNLTDFGFNDMASSVGTIYFAVGGDY